MDALRNTLLEWSLTASPCSTAAHNPDVWGPMRLSEDEGAHSGHRTGDSRLNATWKSRRHHDSRNHTNVNSVHNHTLNLNHNHSSYRSLHDADNEEYDDRRHLRAALHSVVGASNGSSRASMDLRSSRNSSPYALPYRAFSSAFPDDDREGLDEDEDDDAEATSGAADVGSNRDSTPHLVTMLPTTENEDMEGEEEKLALPSSQTQVQRLEGNAARSADVNSNRVEAGEKVQQPPMSPLKLSMTLLQSRRQTPAPMAAAMAATPTLNVSGAHYSLTHPPLSSRKLLCTPHTPLPATTTSFASSKSFRVHSSASSGYGLDEDHEQCNETDSNPQAATHTTTPTTNNNNMNTAAAPGKLLLSLSSANATLLRPSRLHGAMAATAAQAPQQQQQQSPLQRGGGEDAGDGGSTGDNNEDGDDHLRRPSRHLVPLREVFDENMDEDDITVSDIPLHVLHPDLDTLNRVDVLGTDAAMRTAALGGDGRVQQLQQQQQEQSGKEREFDSITQGLTISMAIASVAANLSRTGPTKSNNSRSASSGSSSSNAKNNNKHNSEIGVHVKGAGAASVAVAEKRTRTSTPASPALIMRHSVTSSTKTPSHLSSPITTRPQVSPLQSHAPLEPDDHAAAHVLPRPSGPASPVVLAAAAVPNADATNNTETEADNAETKVDSTDDAARQPLLIPQPHRCTRDMNGKRILLRTHRHFSAWTNPQDGASTASALLSANARVTAAMRDAPAHVPHSAAGVGLNAVPQPYGAYPYQWMVATDSMMGSEGGGSYSSSTATTTATNLLLRRASSSAAVSNLSSYGAMPGSNVMTGMQRSASDGQLYTTSSAAAPPQVWCE